MGCPIGLQRSGGRPATAFLPREECGDPARGGPGSPRDLSRGVALQGKKAGSWPLRSRRPRRSRPPSRLAHHRTPPELAAPNRAGGDTARLPVPAYDGAASPGAGPGKLTSDPPRASPGRTTSPLPRRPAPAVGSNEIRAPSDRRARDRAHLLTTAERGPTSIQSYASPVEAGSQATHPGAASPLEGTPRRAAGRRRARWRGRERGGAH